MVNENKSKITTIKINRITKARLDKLKTHKRESYDETIQKTLSILNTCKLDPERARHKLKQIDKLRILRKQEVKIRD